MGATLLPSFDEKFFGSSWPAPGRDRLFFAIQPEFRVLESIAGVTASLVKRHGLRGRPRSIDTLHISILGLGLADEIDPEHVAIAAEAARSVVFRPFALTLTEAVSIQRWDGNALVLRCGEGSEAITELAHALFDRMLAKGCEPRGTADARPYLTLLHDPTRVPPTRLAWPIHLDVRGFSLVRSQAAVGRQQRETFTLSA